jgi:hypothetical protein
VIGWRREHKHEWQAVALLVEVGVEVRCSCGAVVRVIRTERGIMPEVVADGGHTFSRRDALAVVAATGRVLGGPG